jgi:metal-responsive CopG/Arc/MetJ family transcriptional regulator
VAKEIRITKKNPKRGDDGHKVVTVRMPEEILAELEEISVRTNRSRNEVINFLLKAAIDIVEIEE